MHCGWRLKDLKDVKIQKVLLNLKLVTGEYLSLQTNADDFLNLILFLPVKNISQVQLISFKHLYRRTMKFSTGKMAKLANGAVVVEVKL